MIQSISVSHFPAQQSNFVGGSAVSATNLDQPASPSEISNPVPVASRSEEATAENHAPSGQLSKELITVLQGEEEPAGNVSDPEVQDKPPPPPPPSADDAVSEAEETQIDSLQSRDQEVRSHEHAHANAGGAYAGSPSYEYQTGPDGKRYAVGGEVQIDTAPIAGDPSATIAKMDTVIRAALAPAEPSGQDRSVASAAARQRSEAQSQLNAERQADRSGEAISEPTNSASTQSAEPIINLIA